MTTKTDIILWRIGKLYYAQTKDIIATTESINPLEKEQVRQMIELKLGIKFQDNKDERLKNSFTDESNNIEVRYHYERL